jgi:hypothetical protein
MFDNIFTQPRKFDCKNFQRRIEEKKVKVIEMSHFDFDFENEENVFVMNSQLVQHD